MACGQTYTDEEERRYGDGRRGEGIACAQQPAAQITGALSQNPARRYPSAHVQLRAGQATRRVSVERRAFLRGGADESLLPQMPHAHEHISKPGRRQARESQSRATRSHLTHPVGAT
jgi:hypothetical protein